MKNMRYIPFHPIHPPLNRLHCVLQSPVPSLIITAYIQHLVVCFAQYNLKCPLFPSLQMSCSLHVYSFTVTLLLLKGTFFSNDQSGKYSCCSLFVSAESIQCRFSVTEMCSVEMFIRQRLL